MFIPDSVLKVADCVLEFDVAADPKYAGWAPGTTSLDGFAREITFWQLIGKEKEEQPRKIWRRGTGGPAHTWEYVFNRWKSIVKDGLGEDWTERKGHDQVRQLLGPSEYVLLNINTHFRVTPRRLPKEGGTVIT